MIVLTGWVSVKSIWISWVPSDKVVWYTLTFSAQSTSPPEIINSIVKLVTLVVVNIMKMNMAKKKNEV